MEDEGFAFTVLAVTAFVFLGGLMLLWAACRSRLRRALKAFAISALVLVASASAFFGAGFVELTFLWSSGEVADGDFVVKTWSKPDGSGGTTELHALYFRGNEVADHLERYVHHPTRPAVVMYERFPISGPGATYAFDGDTFRTLRLTPLYGVPVDPDHQWSPDKTRLVMNVDGLYLFDVARWRVSHLTGQGTPSNELHSVLLAGWSPGSRRFAVIDPGKPPFPNQQPVVLTEWDAETLMARTVGCMSDTLDRGAWQATDFAWQDDVLVITPQGPRDAPCADSRQ